jgi:hypothetical protein
MTPIALALSLLVTPASAGDDLGGLLDSIPDIETKAPETEETEEDRRQATLDEDLGQVSIGAYQQQVRDHVLAAMSLPKGVVKKSGAVEYGFVLKITSSGKIDQLGATKLADDKKLDKKVIEAVRAAGPVPKPPIVHRDDALRGIKITFTVAETAP